MATNYAPEKVDLFLVMLRETSGHVKKAAEAAGVGRRTVYDWREAHAEFAAQWDEITDAVNDDIEHEIRRRGIDGVERPYFYKGEQVATVREFSDNLLMFYAKKRMPEYRENFRPDGAVDPVDSVLDAKLAFATMRANPDLASVTDTRLAEIVAQQFPGMKAEYLLTASPRETPTEEATEAVS
jgi:hypothetical protein